MPVRILKTLRVPLSGLAAALGLGLASPVHGQAPPSPAPAQFDPSDVYFQGYLSTRSAEQLEAAGNFIGALEKLRKADQLFGAVRTYYPEWKPEMVNGRCEKNTEAIGKVQAKAEEQLKANRNTVAELEGGEKKSGTLIDPAKDFIPPTREILKVDPLVARRLADAEAEVKRLRDLAAKAKRTTPPQSTPPPPANDQERLRDQSRLSDVTRQRDALQTELRNAEKDAQALRDRLAQAPAPSEIKTLNQRIGILQQDRESATRRLADAETEIKKLRDLASNPKPATLANDQERRRDQSRLNDVTRQRDALQAELRTSENDAKALRARLAEAPAPNEIKTLNQRIGILQQDRENAARRLADAENEVQKLRDLAANAKTFTPTPAAPTNDQENLRDKSRLNDLARQRDALQAELRNAENDAKALRARLAEAPAANEIKTLNQRIGILQQDRESATRRLADAENEIKKLRDLAANAKPATPPPTPADDPERLRDKSRLNDVTRQRDSLNADLKAAENNLQILRSRLAAAPVESEMKNLNQRIQTLEQEREAMSMALRQSQGAHSEAMTNIASLQTELAGLQTQLKTERQKYTDLNRDSSAERKVANDVVAGQRRQLDILEKQLETKNTQLAEANNRISSLMNELQQSHDAFAQIRDERDSLLQERDQMAALLKLNEGGRIQQLIEQNMALAKTLREANEKFERVSRDNSADKDAIADAARDLAIAKSQINRLHQDKRAQDKRLAELESRLKTEEQALAKGQVSADPAEVEVLRDIIKRQLRIQERRRQARDLLVEAARDLGSQDERLAKAIALFDAQEIALTPEEQKLIADKQVDGEFVSPFARDRAVVGVATAELNRDINIFERTAEKSFMAGRLLPTRELYEMILEQNPGHTPSLCKLGIVHLKLNEPQAASDAFRRALELDSNNSYAFRMFGYSLMKLGDIPAAEQAARRSVELAPNDAKNHVLLANLCYRLGRSGEAESHFKAAITADPLPSEPYYNLALIYSRDGRIKDAKNYYQQALERGALPDPELEDILAKK
jgi:tetratricopeptide (TPR) repeat protein/predicted  nucleic acid-binding Zn-ribbon protein